MTNTERADADRNRRAILAAASTLFDAISVDCVRWEALPKLGTFAGSFGPGRPACEAADWNREGRPTVITHGELDKLLSVRAPDESVLSLYLQIPLDPAQLRELPAKVADLVREAADGRPSRPQADDEQVARDVVAAYGREWLGHTLAVFACEHLGLLEVVQLPGGCGERAVWAVRPHVRPLLTALQRYPDHRIAIIDRRNARLLAVSDDIVYAVASAPGDTAPSKSFGGWHGLESYHLERRILELKRHHYREAVMILSRATREGGPQPLVIGGHLDGIKHLLAELPPEIRDRYAGCFAADPHALTVAEVRKLAAPAVAHWAERREQQVAKEVSGTSSDVRAAVGLDACLAAVNDEAVAQLLIPDQGLVPGYVCERCGVLSVSCEGCCDWGAASRAVPDLLEEMALRTLRDGGEVISIRDPQFTPAASLR